MSPQQHAATNPANHPITTTTSSCAKTSALTTLTSIPLEIKRNQDPRFKQLLQSWFACSRQPFGPLIFSSAKRKSGGLLTPVSLMKNRFTG
ncbi:MAG: hypothetical protein DWI02_05435 [Planctomycetota bacterium]|jgi:hypothetical protein|nr:MAG: hypothetical protein DWI02_05435 [Planctomycetota bacterium]